MKRNSSSTVQINIDNCKYRVVRDVAKNRMRWGISRDESIWDVIWLDSGATITNYVRKAMRFQRINHFPGMVQIYRKGHLARAINKMKQVIARFDQFASEEYDFVPETWLLPGDIDQVKEYFVKHPDGCLIIKPTTGAQGKGISIALSAADLIFTQESIAQAYVTNPLLIDGLKFDLRIYALIISCDPLRVLIYEDGLVRLCTAVYSPPSAVNLECQYMHLTNYAINKRNQNYVHNDDTNDEESSKRTLPWLWSWLEHQGHEPARIWFKISDIIVKTLISIQASLASAYNLCKTDDLNKTPFTCFEVLGFDILLRDNLEPVLLEVNHMPSFSTDTKLDTRVKSALIFDTMQCNCKQDIMNIHRLLAHSAECYCGGKNGLFLPACRSFSNQTLWQQIQWQRRFS